MSVFLLSSRCLVRVSLAAMVPWFIEATPVLGQTGGPLCEVTLEQKGALGMGNYYRNMVGWGTNLFVLQHSFLEEPSRLFFLDFNAKGENLRITGSIENFWTNDPYPAKLLVARVGDILDRPRLYVQGPNRIGIVDIQTRKEIGALTSSDGEFRDLAMRGTTTGYILLDRYDAGLHLVELRIVDFTDPISPKFLGKYVRAFDSEGTWTTWNAEHMGVAVFGGWVYLAQGSRLDIIDVWDPTSPAQVGSFTVDAILNAITITYRTESGARAFVGGVGPQGTAVYVLDLADPINPKLETTVVTWSALINRIENPAAINHGNLVFVNESLFIGGGTELRATHIFDLADPSQPQPIGPAIRSFPSFEAISILGHQIFCLGLEWDKLTISPAQIQPRLVIRKNSALIELRWSGEENYVLEKGPSPSGSWSGESSLNYDGNGNGLFWYSANAPMTNTFFRLVRPSP